MLTNPVDLLIVDNPQLDSKEIYETVKPIPVVDLEDLGAAECYKALRKGNLFTHRVAWPESIEYMYADDKVLQYNKKFLVK